jgi:hypothetical protein
MPQTARDPLGAPTIDLGGFHLWIHGRQFPDALDRWDGNWLHVTAHCAATDASVTVSGPVLDAVGLKRFRDELAALERGTTGDATLSSDEPNIRLRVAGNGSSRLHLRVELSSRPEVQGHWFEFDVDRGRLAATLRQLEGAVEAFPIRGQSAPRDLDADDV